ncbi:MAG: glycosyltransferase family 2 protein [Candidatus Ancillula sp.]|jgi:dolichol-phosphate mannosyltransferase|nr:glycosyltransferase family 2 protein [Candidatus Ancillula sp.]
MISFVCPVYNEQDSLVEFFLSLRTVVSQLDEPDCAQWEVIFVNDGSTDATCRIVDDIIADDASDVVKQIVLARNYGKEVALSAGLQAACGDAVLMLDSDGQHPVDLIPEFIAKWRNGAQSVVGIRRSNRKTGRGKKLFSKAWGKMQKKIFEDKMPEGMTDFCLLDREVVNAVNGITEHGRMMRSLVNLVGFDKAFIEFDALERIGGTPTYTFKKLYNLTLNSITSLSTWPLTFILHFGILVSVVSFLVDLFVVVEKYLLHDPFDWDLSGAAIVAVSVVVLVGIVFIVLGVLGLYISKITKEVQGRPLFIINKRKSTL